MPDAPQLDRETVERLRTGLRFIALQRLTDPDRAENAVQETLARGMAALQDGRLTDPKKLGAYFRGIIYHVINDIHRESGRVRALDGLPEPTDGNPRSDALGSLISAEQKARVVRALRELSPSAQECLRLSFYEGLKPAEIAERLGEPGPRIRKRRSRALERLREVFFEQSRDGGHDPGRSPTLQRGHEDEGDEPTTGAGGPTRAR